jgi:hypothetical protein
MEFWYLGALRAMEEMARHFGEAEYADDLRRLFEQGSAWTQTNLFNGEYYEHQILATGKRGSHSARTTAREHGQPRSC